MKKLLMVCFVFSMVSSAQADPDRWLQRVEYKMEIDFDVKKHRFEGKQSLKYTNNSPDELNRVFYHLYFNAFQPGSMMDQRAQAILDPDPRIRSKIGGLSPEEIGYHKINSLKQNGKSVSYEVVGTILEVELNEPILPGTTVDLEMEFESQVPVQIRRSGRHNAEGIDYSMSQWYPKMCEYDYQGWHANPYIGREFHGVWGDFEVVIHIDRNYILGASGHLQNPQEIGYGYEMPDQPLNRPAGDKLSWHFKAENVHDFVWAADPDYKHTVLRSDEGVMMHFLYQESESNAEAWARLPEIMNMAHTYMNRHFGKYPYDIYYFIQGGDGGMEYPMATLITGNRNLGSLVGVSVHEWMHSWYQMVLATNESLYAWMDEGFTSYATSRTMNYLKEKGAFPGQGPVANPHLGSYRGYANFALSGAEEPLIIHADHFMTNTAYGIGAYSKGAVFLHQLEYIIGKPAFDRGLLRYYDTWKFKHPNANDFIRIMEKESGLELDWYREYWINTTHTIDYGVRDVQAKDNGQTTITLEKNGIMPMPVDVLVTQKNGEEQLYNIPLQIMRGDKGPESEDRQYQLMADWPWTQRVYELVIPVKYKNIAKVEIDPSGRMADLNVSNDRYEPAD